MAGIQGRQVGVAHRFVAGELGLNPVRGAVPGLIEHPQHQPKRPEVLAAGGVLGAQAEGLDRLQGEMGDVDAANLVGVQAAVLKGVGGEVGAFEALRGEGAFVNDDQRCRRQVRQVDDQGRRIEGEQHVRRIPRRGDPFAAELNLKGGNAVPCAGRRTDLRRKVRQGGQVMPGQGRSDGELLPLQLDAVPGVPGEAHYMAGPFAALLEHEAFQKP